ncbi:lantibiotic dehydratase [Thermus scotoductus]|jgi:thiopeptide-type bacteriocin biosynthesis protein|nr:lantibiotic dehydratase [Thermus scotoductus]
MVRVPLFPVEWYLQALSAPDGLADYLLEILREPAFMEALWLASPSLAREAERWRDGEKAPGTSQLLGLLRYLIRATTRPTPFGLFAGVAFVPIEEQTRLRLAGLGSHQKRARLDYGQALAFVQSLERDPALRSELYVYANPALLRWYSRIRVTCRDGYGRGQDPGQAWIRLTDPVQVILEYAARPVQYGDLIRRLQERYPQSSEVDIDLFLLKLLDESVLLSTLRPPLTEMEPHSYLARMIPPTSPPSETTERVLQASRLIQEINATKIGEGTKLLKALYEEFGLQQGDRQHLIQMDLRLGLEEASLSHQVIAPLQKAARLLAQLFGTRSPAEASLRQYAQAFLERYGLREVPLLELLDEELGLGPPPGYHNPPPRRSWARSALPEPPELREIYHILAEQVSLCLREGRLDLDLEDVALPQSELEVALPPAVEVFFSIHGEGETPTLVISPAGFVTSRGGVFGRFAYIDERFHQMLRALAEEEVHRYPDYAFAEVVYSDRVGHHTNVALHPSLYPYQIAVGVAPSVPFERQIPLSELMVGVDGQRFYVYSPSLDRIVLPRAPHVLNPQLAPNSVRFLREVGEQGLAVVPTWQWGPLSTLPFLPRVRLGQVVLAPARWRLPRPLPRDLGALDRWRAQWQVPRYVYIGSHDNRLLLDLDHPACFELLRREAPEYVEEAPDPHSAWVSGGSGHHMAEYVLRLPLGSAGESYPQRAARSVQSLDPVRRMRFPGQRVIYLKLYGPATFQNDILFALHQFLKEHGSPNWFFVRYQDPDDHLRVRIFGKEGELGEFLSRFSREAHRYAENGFLLRWATDTYEPEFERYGGEAGLAVCEEIFCVETRALLELFALKPPLPLRELALFSVDGLLEGLGMSAKDRYHLYHKLVEVHLKDLGQAGKEKIQQWKREFGQARSRLWQVMSWFRGGTVGSGPPADQPAKWYGDFKTQLGPLGRALQELERRHMLLYPIGHVAASLIHMNANRLGLFQDEEHRLTYFLYALYDGFRHYIPATLPLTWEEI